MTEAARTSAFVQIMQKLPQVAEVAISEFAKFVLDEVFQFMLKLLAKTCSQ